MKVRIAITIAVGIVIAVSGLVRAQSDGGPSAEFTLSAAEGLGAGYDLAWHTVDNGGATFRTGNGYQLGGAIGQPDAGMLSGGDYTLAGGFWRGWVASKPPEYHIFLPLLLRQA